MFKIDSCIPPDERFSPQKLSEFAKKVIQATLHFVVSQRGSVSREETNQFNSFNEIKELFSGKKSQGVEEWMIKKLEAHLPKEIFKEIGQGIKDYTTKFPMMELFAGDAGFMNIRLLNLPSPRQVLFHVWIIHAQGTNWHGRMMRSLGARCLQELMQL